MTTCVTVCVPLSLDPTSMIEETSRRAGHDVSVRYRPDLLPQQRFPADHRGAAGFSLGPSAESEWEKLLGTTTVAFGIPGDQPAGLVTLARHAPELRWVQGTAAGTGEQLVASGLDSATLRRLLVTSAAGIHAVPLAEFAVFGLLALAKDIDLLSEANSAGEWRARWPMRAIAGSHIVIVGLGGIGRQYRGPIVGVRGNSDWRTARRDRAEAARSFPLACLGGAAGRAAQCRLGRLDVAGHCADSRLVWLRDDGELASHATLVNVGRGSVVDSAALAVALDSGSLRGAVLDVTDVEPLPADSPLWHRPNVIISPHTAALTVDEDDRLTMLFADNLCRLLEDRPLRNLVDVAAGY